MWADASGPWGTDRLTRIITRETEIRLGNRLTTLDYRHVAITMGRIFVGDQFGHGYREEIGEVEEPEVDVELENGLELQAGCSEKIGTQRYGVSADIVKHLSVRSIEVFRSLSEAWHTFLGLDSRSKIGLGLQGRKHARGDSNKLVLDQSATERRTRFSIRNNTVDHSNETAATAGEDQTQSGQTQSWHQVRNDRLRPAEPDEINKAMQKALGCREVRFRSEQQQAAMEAILAGDTPLIVILPTSGGKSLLFMVPGCLEDPGVTIVVVPFRALINDLVDRLRRTGIDCMEWKSNEVNPAAIVVVSADVAASWKFLNYASLLERHGILRRVVIDECHLIFTSSDYRPKLAKLKDLRAIGCQMVLMTATLPPLLEHELEESMLVRLGRYIRASTVRKNIRYIVRRCKSSELIETAVRICTKQRDRMEGQKGVVYCRSRAQCEEVAEELGCDYYHAAYLDKEADLDQWLKDGGFVAATSALGTGVDYKGITFVLHVGMPYGMIDFAQESGRAGRAGEAVDSMVLTGEEVLERGLRDESKIDERAMMEFIKTRDCRRGVMSEYLDGERIECKDINGAMCDRCGERQTEWQKWNSNKELEWERVRRALDEMKEGCAACWIVDGEEDGHMHSGLECRKYKELSQQECDESRKEIVYEKGSHSCTKCGISQKLCMTGVEEGMKCQWPHVMIAVLRAGMGNEEVFKVVRQVGFEGEFRDWGRYSKWLGRRHGSRIWGEWMSNGTVVMMKIISAN